MIKGKISLILPTRNRPQNIERLYKSVMDNAKAPTMIEFCLYLDNDETQTEEKVNEMGVKNIKIVRGERVVLSQMWNEALKVATGEIIMHSGDDLIFHTKDWDALVRDAFKKYPDKIALVHGDDGFWKEKLGTHCFVHRNWIDTVGYLCPPYFASDYNDTWLNDVANELGRKVYLPNLFTEHMHWTFNKAPKDQTHVDRINRHQTQKPEQLYHSKEMREKRGNDVKKLANFIETFKSKGE